MPRAAGCRCLVALAGAAWAAAALPQGRSEGGAVPERRLEELLESGSTSQKPTRRYAEADFAPYFGSAELARAKALFDRRRWRSARAALRGDEAPVRYLRALAGLETDPARAASELQALAADYPQMRDHCLFQAARALERLHRRSAAAAAFGEVS
ncbi:MAG TPA: hypothetical protein VIV57_01325, partial [Anaeromyxobacter sp.]